MVAGPPAMSSPIAAAGRGKRNLLIQLGDESIHITGTLLALQCASR
jgi:hypothetical protein